VKSGKRKVEVQAQVRLKRLVCLAAALGSAPKRGRQDDHQALRIMDGDGMELGDAEEPIHPA
jgi:hypothetical protein